MPQGNKTVASELRSFLLDSDYLYVYRTKFLAHTGQG